MINCTHTENNIVKSLDGQEYMEYGFQHTSSNYILLGEVKEEGWMEEMYELMENIKSPEMRRLALKQLRCVAEV